MSDESERVTLPRRVIEMLPVTYRVLIEVALDPMASTTELAERADYRDAAGNLNPQGVAATRNRLAYAGLLRRPTWGDAPGACWVVNV